MNKENTIKSFLLFGLPFSIIFSILTQLNDYNWNIEDIILSDLIFTIMQNLFFIGILAGYIHSKLNHSRNIKN